MLREQHVQGGEDGPAAHLAHGGDGEGQVPRGLAAGSVDEPQGIAVAQQARRYLYLAHEPLELRLGARRPTRAAVVVGRLIERGARGQRLDEHQGLTPGHAIHDSVGGAQSLVVVGQDQLDAVGDRRAARGTGDVVGRPAEHGPEEGR